MLQGGGPFSPFVTKVWTSIYFSCWPTVHYYHFPVALDLATGALPSCSLCLLGAPPHFQVLSPSGAQNTPCSSPLFSGSPGSLAEGWCAQSSGAGRASAPSSLPGVGLPGTPECAVPSGHSPSVPGLLPAARTSLPLGLLLNIARTCVCVHLCAPEYLFPRPVCRCRESRMFTVTPPFPLWHGVRPRHPRSLFASPSSPRLHRALACLIFICTQSSLTIANSSAVIGCRPFGGQLYDLQDTISKVSWVLSGGRVADSTVCTFVTVCISYSWSFTLGYGKRYLRCTGRCTQRCHISPALSRPVPNPLFFPFCSHIPFMDCTAASPTRR